MLSGSVRQRERKQRVALHLIETASGSVVSTWILDVDSFPEVAKPLVAKIASSLGVGSTPIRISANSLLVAEGNVTEVGGTANTSARGYYERGKEFFFRQNYSRPFKIDRLSP